MSAHLEFRRNREGDGYVATVTAHDGAELELQLLDEQHGRPGWHKEQHSTWEILWSRGVESTLHHLSIGDVRLLGEALVGFADLIAAKGKGGAA